MLQAYTMANVTAINDGGSSGYPRAKRYQCLLEARAYSVDRMKRMRIHKRESLMPIMIHEQ
jgi:hypothetical protein